jgi:ferric-dicitrate binding protein FerR (iron transport regulator)
MILIDRKLPTVVIAFIAFIFSVLAASAQSSGSGCSLNQIAGTSRQILRCQKGLTITIEAGARLTLVDRDKDGNADQARLRRKALLLEAPRGKAGTGFQVVTPQAIAAVRGTKWVVDVQKNKTSVFVVRGRVAVRRPAAKTSVFLGPGEGVEVDKGVGSLTVERWPAARVSALLARFGR